VISIVRGTAAAELFLADFALIEDTAVLRIDTAEAWAGAVWRIGRRAYSLHLEGAVELDATSALEIGLVDAIVPAGWDTRQWIGLRSRVALSSAAELIRRRGGDALERAEFARLFAAGEPQRGLDAFLRKEPPRFDGSGIVVL
jgi:enoyl-CoA hydratase/carnithine racemase